MYVQSIYGCRYMGCFWHYCPICYPNDEAKNIDANGEEVTNITGIDRRRDTEYRVKFLRDKGFIVRTIRSCEFQAFLKSNKDIRDKLLGHSLVNRVRLEPRDALKGGR
jgi:G:T-mismatch repair DNA endonuclease (very short patch repair protein)